MRRLWQSLYFSPLFFGSGAALVFLFAFSFAIPPLFVVAQVVLILLGMFLAIDIYLLYSTITSLTAKRHLPEVIGLADDTEIVLRIQYEGSITLHATLIEELPIQLQARHFRKELNLSPGMHALSYHIKAINRGMYHFGESHMLLESPLKLIRRRLSHNTACVRPVYPSIQHMRNMSLLAFNRNVVQQGAKRLIRIGKSYEFEQISPFVEGDDFRNVNWKATGKTRELMVNQFQDERSQNLYCVISKGRSMKISFKGMSLLDYAINTTLAISNIALKKYDKVGLITFSNVIGTALRSENRRGQLHSIMQALFNEKERDLEPSYELLYKSLERIASNRSLILLFANFTTLQMLERVMPVLVKISRKHLLAVVLFKDDELDNSLKLPKQGIDDVYTHTLAHRYISEKDDIARKLRSQGIHSIIASPEQLSVETINKYLELKRRGMI